MHFDTHVYLGPTLDVTTATQHLWDAHYHPPIQCGDLIRLLRLKPKRVLIIDGIYESVPAVWHKEIMLLLSQQIAVYGAASMGALRAAELSRYGMKGIGTIFTDFAQGNLVDDDEVAVLHQGKEENYLPINEAMVNIRATCELAYVEKKLTQDEKNQLITHCKNQFYPYRSLKLAQKQLNFDNQHDFTTWFDQQGLIDLKKDDAIMALTHIQTIINQEVSEEKQELEIPATKFLTSLIDETEGTPFAFQANWLPDIENNLYQLSIQNPTDFSLVNKLATLLKHCFSHISSTPLPDKKTSLAFVDQHQMYLPLMAIEKHEQSPVLVQFDTWILHQICIHHISKQQIEAYVPILPLYFNLNKLEGPRAQNILEWIVLLVLLSHLQLNDNRLKIKQPMIAHHLRDSGFWFRYHQQKHHHNINLHTAIDFIAIYMQVNYIYQGFRDVTLGQPALPNYFNWIYDALMIYECIPTNHER